MSLITIFAFKKHFKVDEGQRRTLNRITANPVKTYGIITTPITINGQIFLYKFVNFDVVTLDFRIAEF